jgi:hypothetical protein
VTLPTSDHGSSYRDSSASSSDSVFSTSSSPFIPRRPQTVPSSHSIESNSISQKSSQTEASVAVKGVDGNLQRTDHEHAIDFATHSWDLATGGLKALTAKRELSILVDRCPSGMVPDILVTSRRHLFVLVILGCVMLMLAGGGMVLFVLLQP